MQTQKCRSGRLAVAFSLAALLAGNGAAAGVCNLKVVTDASPDYSDLPSLLHSATAKWASPQEKCWALFYWNHIGRRQTAPMILHGLELTDPIRQFNDYGYPWWDSLKGEVQDRVEVLTSLDGQEYRSQGFLKLNLFWKDLPVNYMWTDQETMTSGTFRLVPDRPMTTRFVQYRIRNRRFFDCAGLEVLDTIGNAPFDLRIALPDEAGPAVSLAPDDDGSERSGRPDAKGPPSPNGETRAVVISQPASSGSELAANPMGEPVLEPSTLHSLGVYWIIRGDDNKNATVALDYRQAGAAEWRPARPLFRVEKGANRLERGESRVKVPSGAWLFAGSVVLLEPDTAYDLRLRLSDPDGGAAERILQARTAIEPAAPAGSPQYHVVPGAGGGSGTRSEPYRGLAEAQVRAKAGAIFLLHAGLHEGTFTVTRSGEPGRPIVWRGAGDGEAVLDGQGTQGRVIAASGTHDVWFEQLCVWNAQWGLVAHDAARVVIRRCHFYKVKSGITATRNDRGTLAGFFIADNLIEGPCSWPSEAKGAPVEEDRGIEISGAGQEVCYNRVRNFKDGIDTFPSQVCAAIDIHHNDVSECLDDGCEMDYSVYRNNLFIGTGGNYAYECDPPMIDCDFDYDGFGGGPWKLFLKWNNVRYATAREVREKAPVYRHVTVLDAASVFASGIQPPGAWAEKFDGAAIDLRLKPGTPAIDAGEVLPGFNDGYKGKAPDLGAYELGDPLPDYGPGPACHLTELDVPHQYWEIPGIRHDLPRLAAWLGVDGLQFAARHFAPANGRSLGASPALAGPDELAAAQECRPRGGLPNVIEKLRTGAEVRVAYLGGSITAQDGWRPKTLNWLRQQFPGAKVSEINAAIGGTGSDLGVFRLQHDVLDHHPDLLLVEFAVNDGGASPGQIYRCMEGIVRQTWRNDPRADICFVYTLAGNMLQTLQEGRFPRSASAMEKVADYYGIPSIHTGLEVARLEKAGKLIFKGDKPKTEAERAALGGRILFSPDAVHPYPDTGHQLYLEAVARSFVAIQQVGQSGPHILPAPFVADNWEKARMIPLSRAQLSSGWRKLDAGTNGLAKSFGERVPGLWEARQPGESVSFRFRGTTARIYDLLGPDCGQVTVALDDRPAVVKARFDAFCTYHRLATLSVGEELPDVVHTVKITVHPDQPDKARILSERGEKIDDPKRFDGTAWYAGGILLIGELVDSVQARPAERWSAVISPDNSLEFSFVKDQAPVGRLGLGGWGPNWQWVGLSPERGAPGERLLTVVPFVVDQARGEVIEIGFQAAKTGPRQVSFRYRLSAAKDVPLTLLIASVGIDKAFGLGQLRLTHADGQRSERPLPFGRGAGPVTSNLVLHFEKGGDLAMALDPPCPIAFDGDMRIVLASEVFKAGSRTNTLTVSFPSETALVAGAGELAPFIRTLAGPDWFAFAPAEDAGPSVISMNGWLDRPAGTHGGVRMSGDHFEFEDKTPVKFWGVNLSYGGACAPEKKTAEFTAARFAKYGVNGVRLHKFSYPTDQMGIGELNDATQMTPEGLDRLDYFSAQLKSNGVYFGWSHTYGFHVCPGNRSRLLAYDEIERNLKGNTYGFINFAEDVQDLMIEMVVNLLRHRNPYTGRTYAQEPALSFVELQNEDDIFFYTSEKAFAACPTYRKLFTARFSDWLLAKYGSEAKLRQAWSGALKPGEALAAMNLEPQTNPWFFSEAHLPGQTGGARQRLLDAAAWLHETQNKFYGRFAKAIRNAGYQGPLCGSPWQAPAMLPHYYNLQSDALVGYIDRHNYFGGGLFDSMLAEPGSGYFSTGLQQVANRPFGLSEWIHVYPSLYSAEGPAIVAAYGMGLQGWDASYEFQSQAAPRLFSERVGWPPWGVWEADVPTQLGQYPALTRMLCRGDVREGQIISTRRVSREELAAGRFGFSDTVAQQGDIKSFGGSVPPEALAAGRVVVELTDQPQPSSFPDLAKYRTGAVLTSGTGQLVWDTAGRGFFTVNTPGTKAVVGFAEGKELRLGEITIQIACPHASLFLTALDRNVTLADANSALLCAVARNSNTGFKYFTLDSRTLDNGRGPILLEPVRATLAFSRRSVASVNVLDHDGRRTGKSLPVVDGRFTIDGARDKTLYYEVRFK